MMAGRFWLAVLRTEMALTGVFSMLFLSVGMAADPAYVAQNWSKGIAFALVVAISSSLPGALVGGLAYHHEASVRHRSTANAHTVAMLGSGMAGFLIGPLAFVSVSSLLDDDAGAGGILWIGLYALISCAAGALFGSGFGQRQPADGTDR